MKQGKRKSRRLFLKIVIPMLMLSILQIVILVAAMGAGGIFSALRKVAYQNVAEKTAYRKNYIETSMNQKTALVSETAAAVNQVTNSLLQKQGVGGAEIMRDKELNKQILSESAEYLISLLRRDMVNDAFLFLDTGSLYDDDGGHKLTGLYLRDMDANANSALDNADIYVQMGSSEIAKSLGLTLDYEWSLYLDASGNEAISTDFFTDAILGFREKEELSDLGQWSPFGRISPSTEPSLKYTVPLVSEDGKVYGVLGIGLLKKTVLASIPAGDFWDESASYALCCDPDADGTYEPILFSGSAHVYLVDEKTVFNKERPASFGLYEFSSARGVSIGDIQEMTLYRSASPYYGQKWALISVADLEKTLSIPRAILKMFWVGAMVSLAISALLAYLISRTISRPVTKMVREIETCRQNYTRLRFGSSRIREIDELADSMAELQIRVAEHASRVSRIITMAGSEIGVFLYDFKSGNVFVGESLIKLLQFHSMPDRDVTIPFEDFKDQLAAIDLEKKVLMLPIFTMPEQSENLSESIQIAYMAEGESAPKYFQFDLTKDTTSVIGLVKDITETVTEKQQIADAKDDEYTEKLLKANEALQDAYVAAKEANSAKTDFLSRMSHDIRTPMNAIIGMTALAEANIDDRSKLLGCLQKIDVSSHYLLSLINEVLDMSKIESGKFVLSEEEIRLSEMIETVTEMIRPMAKEKNHDLRVAIIELVHENVRGDLTRIQQAFVNILSNAVKYTPSGGRIEWLITEKPTNKERIGCYEFVFRDNGIGMSRDFLQKIYDPFERASDVRVSHETGTGLGMAITKNIIEMMDGDIRVESEVGKGSVFTVTIFLKIQESAARMPDAVPSAEARMTEDDGREPSDPEAHGRTQSLDELARSDFSGHRVLLVDDNEINREIACEVLQMAGLEVDMAENGQDAVDRFSASEIDYYQMIFMDIQMPILNGYGAASTIRRLTRKDAASVPIVAMTADAFAEDVKAAKEAGMNEHIAKPLDFDRLLMVLNSYLK